MPLVKQTVVADAASVLGVALDTGLQRAFAAACTVDKQSAAVVRCYSAPTWRFREAYWLVEPESGLARRLQGNRRWIPHQHHFHCLMGARAHLSMPTKSSISEQLMGIECAYLNEILPFSFGDKRLEFRSCESIHKSSLGDDEQQDLCTSENR